MKLKQDQFEQLYQTHYPKVMRLCMGYVKGDVDLAKDLAQEVFIKVWENLGSFRNESAVGTWIYRITVNTCLVQIRMKRSSQDTVAIDQLRAPEEVTDHDYEKHLKQLYVCINKLDPTAKGIILLELEGLPQKEIAAVMGLSHEAVRVRIHRIKNKLTKCVQDDKL